jgi:4-amino-4-deoxy-L-arabinose transferase-like glycosyltransferase
MYAWIRGHGFVAVVVLAMVLALGVRVAIIAGTPGFAPRFDAVDYVDDAVSIATTGGYPDVCRCEIPGGGPTAFRPPAYPYLLAGAFKLLGVARQHSRLTVARVVAALLSMALVALIALIGARLWSRPVGALAAVFAAVYPPFLMVDSSTLSESLFIPLELAGILAVIELRRSRGAYWWAAVAGLSAGLAALTRGNGLILLIPFAVAAASATGRARRDKARTTALLVAVAIASIAPWTVRNAEQLHAFVPVTTEAGYTLDGLFNSYSYAHRMVWSVPVRDAVALFRVHPPPKESAWSGDLISDALHFIGRHPASVPEAGFWNTLRLFDLYQPGYDRLINDGLGTDHFVTHLAVYSVYPLLLLAIAAMPLGVARRLPGFIWLMLGLLLVTTVFATVGTVRYRLPIDPILLLLAAATLVELARRWSLSRRPLTEG